MRFDTHWKQNLLEGKFYLAPAAHINDLFDAKGHFYSPYAMNRYFKVLNSFDIEYFIKSSRSLIDKEYISERIDNVFKQCDFMINDKEIPKNTLLMK